MIQEHTKKNPLRVILYISFIWAMGVVLAYFWGLGWFFLLESLRRLTTYISPLNRIIQSLLFEKPTSTIITNSTDPKLLLISRILRTIILLFWIGATIFVFLKINIPLKDIF